MANTNRFQVPLLDTFQAQKEVTHNEALRILDVLSSLLLASRVVSDPPSAPTDGQAWLVAATATGAWVGQEGKIAIYVDGWSFHNVFEGLRAWVDDENDLLVYSDGDWVSVATATTSPWRIPVLSESTATQVQIPVSSVSKLTPINVDTNDVAVFLPDLSDVTANDIILVKKNNTSDNIYRIYGFVRNALLHSNDLTQSSVYDYSRVTANANQGTDPDGNATLDKIEETSDSGVHELDQEFLKPQGVTRITSTIVAQAEERDTIVLAIDKGNSTHRAEMRVDLADGSIENTNSNGDATYVSADSSVTALSNDNYLIRIAVDVPQLSEEWQIRLRLYNNTTSYPGTTGSGLYAGRLQTSYSTPYPDYAETTTTPDVDQIDGEDFIPLRSFGSTLSVIATSDDWVLNRSEEGLDDGEWIPSVSGSTTSGSQSYGIREGLYTRRGGCVDFWASVEVTTLDAATAGDMRITGMPLRAKNNTASVEYPVVVHIIDGVTLSTNYTTLVGYMDTNSAIVRLREIGSGQAAQNLDASTLSSGFHVIIQGSAPIN